MTIHLVIVTAKGVPIRRDIVLETLRRAAENGGDLVKGFEDLEREMDEYAATLTKAPEWPPIVVDSNA